MRRIQRNHIIQAFATDSSNEPFAMSIGRRHTNRQLQYMDTHKIKELVRRAARTPAIGLSGPDRYSTVETRRCGGREEQHVLFSLVVAFEMIMQ
jgi:hypothetical protein